MGGRGACCSVRHVASFIASEANLLNTASMAKARAHAVLLGMFTAATMSMTACASSSPGSPSVGQSVAPKSPASETTGTQSESVLASFTVERLLTRRHELVVRTRGSSTCPWRVTDVRTADGARALTVSLSTAPETAGSRCTNDLREHREAIPIPAGVFLDEVSEVQLVDTQGSSHTATVVEVGPESLPTRPFTLDCAPGENGSSMTYEYWLEDPTFVDTPEQVAERVLAVHPTWQVVAEETRIGADVAVFDEAGDVKGILLAQQEAGGWFLSAESHCYDTDLNR